MKFLVAIDASEHADRTVRFAAELAAPGGAELVLIHQRSDTVLGIGPAAPPDEGAAAAQALIDSAVSTARRLGVIAVRGRVERGLDTDVARALIDIARTERADLIVVGSHVSNRLQGLLVGDVGDQLLRHSDRPVLVVRSGPGVGADSHQGGRG